MIIVVPVLVGIKGVTSWDVDSWMGPHVLDGHATLKMQIGGSFAMLIHIWKSAKLDVLEDHDL